MLALSSRLGSPESVAMVNVLQEQFGVTQIRFPENVGLGVKPISKQGTERLVKQAIDYAIKNNRSSVTLVHKGNIMKFTEGAFRDWGYEVSMNSYGGELLMAVLGLRLKTLTMIKTL